jgi:hypothetical protein
MTLEDRAAALSQAEIVALLRQNEVLAHQAAELQRQVEWFKRQLFGRKSERRLREPDARQLPLAGLLPGGENPVDVPPPPTETVKAYQRRTRFAALEDAPDESGLRFDPSVPVAVIKVSNPDLVGLTAADYEVIGEKVTYRLAQRPGSYVLLKYVGIVQSLLASCRLQGVDPYVYFVDVLQRIATHPAFEVHLLTPQLWKQHFAEHPLRSDLDRLHQ